MPVSLNGWVVPGDPARLAVVLTEDVDSVDLDVAGLLHSPGVLDSETPRCWRWNLTIEQVASIVGDMAPAANYYSFPFRITTGTGDSLTSLAVGSLNLVDRWHGAEYVALEATILIGPAGAGADADTIAGLVEDYLATNPPDTAALDAHIAASRPHPNAESGRDFAGWFNATTA